MTSRSAALAPLLLSLTLAWLPPGPASAAAGDVESRPQHVAAEREGPAGLAWSRRAKGFLVLPRSGGAKLLTHEGRRVRRLELPVVLRDPRLAAFDNKAHRLVFYDALRRQLVALPAGRDGVPDAGPRERLALGRVGSAAGLAADPVTGRLFLLDASGPGLVVVEPEAEGGLAGARVERIALPDFAPGRLRGLAFDPASGHLHALAPDEARLYEIRDDGLVLASRDLSGVVEGEPEALVFAPSGDGTDDPAATSLYVAEASGQVTELALVQSNTAQQSQVATQSSAVSATLVQHVWTSDFSPPSPDSMGIAYIDAWDSLLMSDSEVNEIPNLFTGDNLFEIDYTTGTLVRTESSMGFSNEPTGVAYDPVRNFIYISHDNSGGLVFEIDPGNDGQHFTNDDQVKTISTGSFGNGDPEGVTFDRLQGFLYMADGVDSEVYELDPGPNGEFGDGDDVVSHFDTAGLGLTDPEGIAFDPFSGNLYVGGGKPKNLVLEVTTSGTLVRTIDTSDANPPNPSGLAYGPSSVSPGQYNLYIVDRGVDNNTDPNENDGQLFEVSFQGTTPGNQPPAVNAGPDQGVTLPDPAVLDGTVSDDPAQTLSILWLQVSGPGTASFADPTSVDTTATFTAAGTYVLRLTAHDGELSGSDEATVTVTGAGGAQVVEIAVAAPSDDAEEGSGGGVSLGSSDLELVEAGGPQTVGMRFAGVPIPPGASITSAWVQFQTDETGSTATSLAIQGQASDDVGTFVSSTGNVSTRPRTAASVPWSPPAWATVGERGLPQRTPDLSPVIAEIVGRSGWASGNALALIVTGTGKRTAESFNGSVPGAPMLHVEFNTTPNDPPGVSIDAPADGSSHADGASIAFSGSASDPEDGDLGASLQWSSSLDGSIGTGASFSRSDLSPGTHVITASVTDSGGRSASDQVTVTVVASNSAPTVSITSPSSGASYAQGQSVSFAGSASDAEDGGLTASLLWTSSLDGVIGSGGSFSRSDLSPGNHSITASVSDSGGLGGSDQVTIEVTVPSNAIPTVSLSSPSNGASYTDGDTVTFTAAAGDAEDGDLTAGLTWSSSRDGALGSGGSFDRSDLSVGTHVVTASVTDSGGATGSDQVTFSVAPVGGEVQVVEVTVAASSDDAEEGAGGGVSLGSSDLELVVAGNTQVVGVRFTGLPIPPGAAILDAWVQFQTDEATVDPTALTIRGHATADAPTFGSAAGDVSTRPTTSASVSWNPDPWPTVGERGAAQRTPNLAPVIAEIVGDGGWGSGNALALIFTGTGKRTAESFDGTPPGAPMLHVEFSGGAPNDAPVVSISAPSDGTSFDLGAPVGFSGSASDTEDGDLGASLQWSSSVDGNLGSGTSFSRSDLSAGTHVITASVTDSGGRSDSQQATISITSPGGSLTVDIPIAGGPDDAEEGPSGVSLGSSDLELIWDKETQVVGLRFLGIPVPQGATIVDARVQFTVDQTDSEPTSLVIHGEAADDAAPFTNAVGSISGRTPTGASVGWSPAPWTVVGQAGPDQRTENLAPVIAEIVSRTGWSSGNALVLIISGTGKRTAESFNGTAPPVLHLEYIP